MRELNEDQYPKALCPVCQTPFPVTPWQSEALYGKPLRCSSACVAREEMRKAA